MNTRLKQFLAAENITQAQFADSINVVRASVSHILSGRNNPSFDFIKAMMSNYPNLNIEWLMFGRGKMYKDIHGTAESNLIFPEEPAAVEQSGSDVSPARAAEIRQQPEETPHNEISTVLNTLDKSMQHPAKQRKVAKVIVMFDDGSYQEL